MVVLLLVFCSAAVALFGSSEDVMDYIRRNKLPQKHVGVAFDVLRGRATSVSLLEGVEVDMDPFTSHVHIKTTHVTGHVDVFARKAKDARLEYLPGMFIHSHLPFCLSRRCLSSARTDELLVMKLRPKFVLGPLLADAFGSVPDKFDAEKDGAFWRNFFAVFPTHYTDAAFVGGRIEVVSTFPSEGSSDVFRKMLDRILKAGYIGRSLFEDMEARVTTLGGIPETHADSISKFTQSFVTAWAESAKANPAVVRYGVRPISHLMSDHKKEHVLEEATSWFLKESYNTWRSEVVATDAELSVLASAKKILDADLDQLRAKRKEILSALATQDERIRLCEEEIEKSKQAANRCTIEAKAFQHSLVQCDQRNYKLEKVEEALHLCETKKYVAGCV